MPRQPRGMTKTKRKNYSLKCKLDVIRDYVPDEKGGGFVALSQKFGVPRSIVRGWWKRRAQ